MYLSVVWGVIGRLMEGLSVPDCSIDTQSGSPSGRQSDTQSDSGQISQWNGFVIDMNSLTIYLKICAGHNVGDVKNCGNGK